MIESPDKIKSNKTKQMKRTIKIMKSIFLALAGVLYLCLGSSAQAQATVRYWDTDGNNPGLGVGGPYDWILDDLWNTSSTGGAGIIGGWTDGDTPVFNGNGVSTVTISSIINCTNFNIGSSAANGTATTLNLSGSGTLNLWGGETGIGFQSAIPGNTGVLNMSGGTFNINTTMYIGRFGCNGTFNQTGGSVNGVVVTDVAEGANGTINVSNNAVFSPIGGLNMPYTAGTATTPNVGTLNIGSGGIAYFTTVILSVGSNNIGTINVNSGGTLSARLVVRGTYANNANLGSTATLNFNGGVYKQRASSADPTIGHNGNSSGPLDAINILSGGAIFDCSGFGVYIVDPLLDGGGGGGLTKTNGGNLESTIIAPTPVAQRFKWGT